jgi:hypothetical protein
LAFGAINIRLLTEPHNSHPPSMPRSYQRKTGEA